MEIKQLKELIKLLRANGVLQYQTTDLNLVLTEAPPKAQSFKSAVAEEMQEDVAFDDMTLDQQLTYSATHPLEGEGETEQ